LEDNINMSNLIQ